MERSERGWPVVDISQLGGVLSIPACATEFISLYTTGDLLQYPNNPRLGLMEYEVVNLIITVHKRAPIRGLPLPVREVAPQVLHVRERAHRLSRVDVADGGLGLADGGPGLKLARVEAGGLAEGGEPDRGRGDGVEGREGVDGGFPPVAELLVGPRSSSCLLGDPPLILGVPEAERFRLGGRRPHGMRGDWAQTYIAVRSPGDTPGMLKSSKILPSKNPMT